MRPVQSYLWSLFCQKVWFDAIITDWWPHYNLQLRILAFVTDAWEILLICLRCQMLLLERWIYECTMKTFKVLWNTYIQHISTWSSARWWLTSVILTVCRLIWCIYPVCKGVSCHQEEVCILCRQISRATLLCLCPFEIMLFIRNFPTLKSLWKMGIDWILPPEVAMN
jgi:hypothetical protein